MNLGALDIGILAPGFLAGLLILSTHVPLGNQVLARGIVFIDLAIAQIAGLGVIAASLLGWEPGGWAVQISAVGAAMLGALLLTYTEKRWPEVQEALIGVLFVLAASGAILLLAHDVHGNELLKDILVGQILWVSYTQLIPLAVLSVLVLVVWFGLRERIGRLGFYILFALAVTASVQLVGVYLVFASLIVPALAARNYPVSQRLPIGYVLGAAGYALGMFGSAWLDLPTGPLIIWVMAGLGIAVWAGCGAVHTVRAVPQTQR